MTSEMSESKEPIQGVGSRPDVCVCVVEVVVISFEKLFSRAQERHNITNVTASRRCRKAFRP
jgi:hypothetical protein